MDGIVRRRGMMEIPSSAPVETWDFEWDYTMGLPENNGMTKTVSGSPTITMQSNGLKIANSNGGYVRYDFARTSTQTGIVEVTFIGDFSPTARYNNVRALISNGSKGGNFCTPFNEFRIMDTAGYADTFTYVQDMEVNIEHTVRIVLKGTTFDMYIDGVKAVADFSCSVTEYTTANRVFVQQTQSPNYAILRSMKIKYSL